MFLPFTTVGSSVLAVADSGTTGHYITADTPCINKTKANNNIPITLTNGDIISTTHIALLTQTNLPDAARCAHIFPHLAKPLISIRTLCNNNYITVFENNQVTIFYKDTHQTVMTVKRYPVTTLYMINMTKTPTLMTAPPLSDSVFADHVYETKTKQDLIMFYRAASFSLSKSTFIQSINCNAFTSWNGLTTELVSKYLPKNRSYCQRPHQKNVQVNQLHATLATPTAGAT